MTEEQKQALTAEASDFYDEARKRFSEELSWAENIQEMMAGFALSRKAEWEREAVRRAFERAMEQVQGEAFSVGLDAVFDVILDEMEAKDDRMAETES